jgi:hypothetical protein
LIKKGKYNAFEWRPPFKTKHGSGHPPPLKDKLNGRKILIPSQEFLSLPCTAQFLQNLHYIENGALYTINGVPENPVFQFSMED